MRKAILHTFLLPLLATVAACSSGAYDDDPDNGNGVVTDGNAYVYLTFSTGDQQRNTRADLTPTPGENGDGREKGQTYENDIEDVTVYFYPYGTLGINSPDDTPLAASHHFSSNALYRVSETVKRTEAVRVENLQTDTPYGIVAVANMGSNASTSYTTLGELRQAVLKAKPWKESAADGYSNFVMASADGDETITIYDGKGTEEDPLTPDDYIDLERLAARVDYRNSADNYSIVKTDNSGNETRYSGTVTINKAAIVNAANANYTEYLLKRVSDQTDGSGTTIYLGKETVDTDGKATNYVIDPNTANKADDTSTAAQWSKMYDNYFSTFGDGIAQNWASIMKKGTIVADPDTKEEWLRIGYTMENVQPQAQQNSSYNTGIVFSAAFAPTELDGYKAGSTFFASGGKLYATLTKAMMAFFGNTSWQNINVKSTDHWGAVREFAADLVANDPAGYRSYLLTLASDKTSAVGEETEKLSWQYYLTNVLCCTESEVAEGGTTYTVATVNGGDETDGKKNTRLELERRGTGTKVYENATCYYTYWLRHADDGDDSAGNGIMENAIVRNNIYKVMVKSVNDLGEDIPRVDPTLNNIVLIVAVKNWKKLEQQNIQF